MSDTSTDASSPDGSNQLGFLDSLEPREGSTDEPPAGSDRPYRLEVKTATPDEIEAANEREGNRRARRYLPPEETIEAIRTQKSASEDRLLSWVHHPDARVPLALIEHERKAMKATECKRRHRNEKEEALVERRRLTPKRLEAVRGALRERALEEADREGVLWTPLIDRLYTTTLEKGNPFRPSWVEAEERLIDLRDWIEEQQNAEVLTPLLGFSAAQMIGIVENAASIDGALFDAVVEHGNTTMIERMATHDVLPSTLAAVLRDWAVASLRESTLPGLRSVREAGPLGDAAAQRILTSLLRQGHDVSGVVDRLVALAADSPRYFSRGYVRPGGSKRMALWALVQQMGEGVEADLLAAIYEKARDTYREHREEANEGGSEKQELRCRSDQKFLLRLLGHPSATPELKHRGLEDAKGQFRLKVRERLVKDEEARQYEAIREDLLASGATEVFVVLCRDAEGEELEELAGRVAEKDPVFFLREYLQDGFDVSEAVGAELFASAFGAYAAQEPRDAIRFYEKEMFSPHAPVMRGISVSEEILGEAHALLEPEATAEALFDGLAGEEPKHAMGLVRRPDEKRPDWMEGLDLEAALETAFNAWIEYDPAGTDRGRFKKGNQVPTPAQAINTLWANAEKNLGRHDGRRVSRGSSNPWLDRLDAGAWIRRAFGCLGEHLPEMAREEWVRECRDGPQTWGRYLELEDLVPAVKATENLREFLREEPRVVELAAFRERVLGSDDRLLLEEACRAMEGTARRKTFRRLTEVAPSVAVELLDDPEWSADALDRRDLLPLLQLEDADLRTRAVRAARRVGGQPQPPRASAEPAVEERASGGRAR